MRIFLKNLKSKMVSTLFILFLFKILFSQPLFKITKMMKLSQYCLPKKPRSQEFKLRLLPKKKKKRKKRLKWKYRKRSNRNNQAKQKKPLMQQFPRKFQLLTFLLKDPNLRKIFHANGFKNSIKYNNLKKVSLCTISKGKPL